MNEFQEKLKSLSFGVTRIKPVKNKETGEQAGEQIYHKDGTISAVVTPKIQVRQNVAIQ